MINILSVRCSLAFAFYLRESIAAFLDSGYAPPHVVRHAGSGLIIRSDDQLAIRYQERECRLGPPEARHYSATIEMRAEAYDVTRLPDEVVMSNFNGLVVLSHPQSELWLELPVVTAIAQMFKHGAEADSKMPEWLTASIGGGQLLLSDQRSGRWVLLGPNHVAELERRSLCLPPSKPSVKSRRPTIEIKGLIIHLQSAFKLAESLSSFAATGAMEAYDEVTPIYTLSVSPCTEGIALRDSENRVAITKREARKWADLISADLDRLNARQLERGNIRTTIADGDGGRWVLQWGDEIFVSNEERDNDDLRIKRIGELTTLLDFETADCVALDDSEEAALRA